LLLIPAEMLTHAFNAIIDSGYRVTVKDLAAIAGADSREFGNRLLQREAYEMIFSSSHKDSPLSPFDALDPACSYHPFYGLSGPVTVFRYLKDSC
jgi:hypothetical protein